MRAPDLADIRAAAGRIAGRVRRTPVLSASPVREHAATAGQLLLKLECLQVTGSFKPRGAVNALSALPPGQTARGIVTASGGNHGLGVAYAGWAAQVPATVFLPRRVGADKVAALGEWQAQVRVAGDAWDDSHEAALAHATAEGLAYIHPFADPAVIAGQGTLGLEIVEDAPEIDTILVAIGGGGLIAGVALAAKALKPQIRIIGVEPTGAPTLKRSLAAGRLVTLDRLDTEAVTLAPRRSDELNLKIIADLVAEIVLVSDDEMRSAARWLWREIGIGAELSGAASVAALVAGRYRPATGERVCAIVCGAGTAGLG